MTERARGRRRRRPRRRGFSIVEIMVCMGLLAVGLLATLAASLSSSQLQQTSRGTKKATMLMNDLLERYRAVGANSLVARLAMEFPNDRVGNYTVNDTDTEASFTITGTVGGEASELVGTTASVTVLTEQQTNTFMPVDLSDPADGVPDVQDLDGNGDPDASDFAAYSIIPLRIVLTYPTGGGQTATITACTVVYPTASD